MDCRARRKAGIYTYAIIMQNNNRLLSADLLKTISIIGVVFIHGASVFGCASKFSTIIGNSFRFAVPCFIIIWAYFFEKSFVHKNKDQRYSYIKKRFTHLFIVYLCWSLVYFLILADWANLTVTKVITTHFWGFGWAGQYFFIVLFQLTLLYPLLRFCYEKKSLRYGIILLTVILFVIYGYHLSIVPDIIKKLGNNPFWFWIVYVFAGIALARNTVKVPKILLLLVFAIPIEFYTLDVFHLKHSEYIIPSVLLVSIVLCAVALSSSIKVNNKLIPFIDILGRNTMTIFVSNSLIIIILNKLFPDCWIDCSIFAKILFPFVSTLVIVSICLIVSKLIKLIKLNGVIN
jgi:surface polysaccharide O-acyltransferase-like enzyme